MSRSSDLARRLKRSARVAGELWTASTKIRALPACALNASTSARLRAPSITAAAVPGGTTASVRRAQMSAPCSVRSSLATFPTSSGVRGSPRARTTSRTRSPIEKTGSPSDRATATATDLPAPGIPVIRMSRSPRRLEGGSTLRGKKDRAREGVRPSRARLTNLFKREGPPRAPMLGQRANCALLALVLAAAAVAFPAAAEGWPQFRGGADKTGIAVDPAPDSSAFWRFAADGAGQFVASPISDGTEVIVVEYTGAVSGLDVRDGSLIWSYALGATVTATPAVAGSLVVVAAGTKVVAVEMGASGRPAREAWSFPLASRVDSAPTLAGGAVYFGADDRNVYKLNLTDGSLLWSFGVGDVVKSSPAVQGSRVYLGSYDGFVYALEDEGASVTEAWRYDAGGEIQSSPALSAGKVFATTLNGRVVAVNAANGGRVWEATPGGVIASSPAVVGNSIVVGGDTLTALDMDNGGANWERPLSGYIRGSPAVVGDLVLVGDYGGVVYAHSFNGTLAWSYDAGSAIRTSPAIAGGFAIVGTDGGQTVAVPLDAGDPPDVAPIAQRNTFAGVSETFSAVASDPEGRGTFFAWQFGDGATASGQIVRHTFSSEGNYTVTLTVSDGELSDSVSAVVAVQPFVATVTGGVEPARPVPAFLSPAVLLGIVGALAAAVLLFAYKRSRASGGSPAPSPAAPLAAPRRNLARPPSARPPGAPPASPPAPPRPPVPPRPNAAPAVRPAPPPPPTPPRPVAPVAPRSPPSGRPLQSPPPTPPPTPPRPTAPPAPPMRPGPPPPGQERVGAPGPPPPISRPPPPAPTAPARAPTPRGPRPPPPGPPPTAPAPAPPGGDNRQRAELDYYSRLYGPNAEGPAPPPQGPENSPRRSRKGPP